MQQTGFAVMAKRPPPGPTDPAPKRRAPRQLPTESPENADVLPLSAELRTMVAKNLEAARVTAGTSKSELARRTGLTRRIIMEVEAGRQNLTLESVERLAQAV